MLGTTAIGWLESIGLASRLSSPACCVVGFISDNAISRGVLERTVFAVIPLPLAIKRGGHLAPDGASAESVGQQCCRCRWQPHQTCCAHFLRWQESIVVLLRA